MSHVVLIACASKKLRRPAPARELYVSALFQLNLRYARSLAPETIYILSAKHGLLELDEVVKPYDLTLNGMSAAKREQWADDVFGALARCTDVQRDTYTFLAGMRYRAHLAPRLANVRVPLLGLGIGRQLQFLSGQTALQRASSEGRRAAGPATSGTVR